MVMKIDPAELDQHVGTELEPSAWITVDQSMIDQFADVTGDHNFIHVDVEKAAASPFGGTIAHGFLTLSLLPQLIDGTALEVNGTEVAINYGFERLRFVSPVPAGKRVRARCRFDAHKHMGGGWHQIQLHVVIDIEDMDKPAIVADWLTRQLVPEV